MGKQLTSAGESENVSILKLVFTAASFLAGITIISGTLLEEAECEQFAFFMNVLGIIAFFLYFRSFPSQTEKKLLRIGWLYCGWVLILKFLNSGLFAPLIPAAPRFMSYPFVFDFLIFLPFAAFDKKGQITGLKILGFFDIAAAIVLGISAVLLCLGITSDFMDTRVFWTEDLRIINRWNPNLSAGMLMNAIMFLLLYFFTAKSKAAKWADILILLLLLFALALTDTTTVFVMISVMFGGILAFALVKGRWEERPLLRWFVLILTGLLFCILSLVLLQCTYSILRNHVIMPAINLNAVETAEVIGTRVTPRRFVTFSGRYYIWKVWYEDFILHREYWLLGVPDVIEYWKSITTIMIHAHNYLIECLNDMGIVGLLLALYLTYLSLKNSFILIFVRKTPIIQKVVSIYLCCTLVTQLMESFLFCVPYPRNYINVVFLLSLGYVIRWVEEPSETA